MKKFLFAPLFTILVAVSQVSQADTVGVWAGAGMWDWDISGSIRYQSTDAANTIDMKDELGLQDDDSTTAFAIIEHPIPVIPNVKVFTTSIESTGSGTISATKVFGTGVDFSGDVNSSIELDQTDLTLYWQVWDTVVGIDLGLNFKVIDGKITITETTGLLDSVTADFSATLPMLYAGLEVKLPLTGLTVAANASYIGYDGSGITEYQAYIRYDSAFVLGVEAGIRSFTFELDDIDQSYGELEFSGVYALLYVHF